MKHILHAVADWLILRTRKSLQQRYPQYQIGRGSYGDDLIVRSWNEGTTLKIGNFCSIASGVKIFLGGEHRSDWVTTYPFPALWPQAANIKGHPTSKGDVVVGNDVWIGAEAIILSGVTIGDGAIIGARAVVGSDVPAYAIAAGNPARVVRYRFDDTTIAQLLSVQWWNWSEERIVRHLHLLLNQDIAGFVEAALRDESQ